MSEQYFEGAMLNYSFLLNHYHRFRMLCEEATMAVQFL